MNFAPISVECYAGYRADETPSRFCLGNRWFEVVDVPERWRTPNHHFFKVKTEAGAVCLLRQDRSRGVWTVEA